MTARSTDFSEAYDSYLRAYLESGDATTINDASRKLFLLWQETRPTAARVAEVHVDTMSDFARRAVKRNALDVEAVERGGLFLVRVLAGLDALRESAADSPQRDRLTGLPNRLSLLADLATEAARSIRHKRPLSLALVTVAGLDEISGATVEVAIYRMAYSLGRATRREDRLYRCGHSEFAVLLADTPIGGAFVAAQRYADSIETGFRPEEISSSLKVDTGVGVATLPMEADDGPTLFDLARRRAHENLEASAGAAVRSLDSVAFDALSRGTASTSRPPRRK